MRNIHNLTQIKIESNKTLTEIVFNGDGEDMERHQKLYLGYLQSKLDSRINWTNINWHIAVVNIIFFIITLLCFRETSIL